MCVPTSKSQLQDKDKRIGRCGGKMGAYFHASQHRLTASHFSSLL